MVIALVALFLSPGASARTRHPACPAGVPVQTITVVNQANVRPWVLVKVERAIVDESMRLRAAWNTPCVRFGAGGWLVYLKVGATWVPSWGEHLDAGGPNGIDTPLLSTPYAVIWTAGEKWSKGTWRGWPDTLSHEIVEMLVDPYDQRAIDGQLVEVCDPVQTRVYRIDGVYVAAFVGPSWYQPTRIGRTARKRY